MHLQGHSVECRRAAQSLRVASHSRWRSRRTRTRTAPTCTPEPRAHRSRVHQTPGHHRPRRPTRLRHSNSAGADIIVGSHAHRVFGAGRVGDSLVACGLGNFVYWSEDGESGRSGVLHVTATDRHVDQYSWVPARITHGIPIPDPGGAAAADQAEWQHRRTCNGLSP